MAGTYELKRAAGGTYMWNLRAANNEDILTSETYTSKAGAENGIRSCRINSPHDERYDRRTASDRSPYFVLRAANGEVLGRSEMYSSATARETGIASCKANVPSAPIVDRT